MLITVKVLRPFTRGVGAGEVTEIESTPFKLVVADFVLTGGIHAHEYSSVLSQNVVDIPDIGGVVAVQSIIERNAASIRTEFFINPASEWRAAFKAGSFRLRGHLIIRLQTFNKRI
jgi:hypothetical protein